MDYISLIGIAIGLAMDAFAVCITNGALCKKVKLSFALKMALSFGIFQAAMPMIGWFIGKAGESFISSVDHWVALILLCFIGGQMIFESIKERKKSACEEKPSRENLSFKTLMLLSLATSIDALATGIILPSAVQASTAALMLLAVVLIGLITFVLCVFGVYIGKKFGVLLSERAQIAGGIVLVLIGLKIFTEHMFLQ